MALRLSPAPPRAAAAQRPVWQAASTSTAPASTPARPSPGRRPPRRQWRHAQGQPLAGRLGLAELPCQNCRCPTQCPGGLRAAWRCRPADGGAGPAASACPWSGRQGRPPRRESPGRGRSHPMSAGCLLRGGQEAWAVCLSQLAGSAHCPPQARAPPTSHPWAARRSCCCPSAARGSRGTVERCPLCIWFLSQARPTSPSCHSRQALQDFPSGVP
mmetsp:Transcript_7719/g.21967  ORF Transcript_7719/g.21967 Transcript_7719/m.21967 type:complete len:215 (-) Transcript_7719:1108-1752(-)